MKFKREFLLDSLDDKASTVEDRIIDHSRWSVHYRRIFRHEGKFYETFYSCGATEMQDESPYQYADAEIECAKVVPVEKTITVYEKKP